MNVWVVYFYFTHMTVNGTTWAYGVFASESDAKDFRDKVEAMGASEAYAENALFVGERVGTDVWCVYDPSTPMAPHTVYATVGAAENASDNIDHIGSDVTKATYFCKR